MSGTIEGRRVFDDVEPLVVRPRVARRMLGSMGTERLWELINDGTLESYLDGTARLITVASIKAYIARRLAAQGTSTTTKPSASTPAASEPKPESRAGQRAPRARPQKAPNKSDAASDRRITT